MRKSKRKLQETLPSLGKILRRLWPEIVKQKVSILVAIIAMLLEIMARLMDPWPLKFIFDTILLVETQKLSSGEPIQNYHILSLTLFTLSILGIRGLGAGATYFSRVTMATAATQIMTRVRGQLYDHIQNLSLSFHTQAKSGDLITRVTYDIERLREVTVVAVLPLLVNSLTLVGMLGVMLVINWELALISLLVIPLFLFNTTRATRQIQGVAKQQRQREGAMAATAAESIGAIKIVQSLSLQEMLSKAFSKNNSKSLKEGARAQRLSAGLERTVEWLVAISTSLVLWRGVVLVLEGQLTPGDLLVFVSYLKTAFKPMRQLAKYTSQISKATASGERVIELLDTPTEIRDDPNAIPAPPFKGSIQFQRVSFGYRPERPTLRQLDLNIPPGQRVAIVGPSGSGKSTLTNLLLRLYDPTSGEIRIDGWDIRAYQLNSLRQQISVVLQENTLFGVSIRDNIAYGCLGATEAEVIAAAKLANAHEFIQDLPREYDSILGERGATLSGGQRQRIAIARAAIRRAPIVILDEPTTGLDNASQAVVLEALERLIQGKTSFWISHDLSTVERADLILYLEKGRIKEHGTHAQLIEQRGHYAKLYHLQGSRQEETYAVGV